MLTLSSTPPHAYAGLNFADLAMTSDGSYQPGYDYLYVWALALAQNKLGAQNVSIQQQPDGSTEVLRDFTSPYIAGPVTYQWLLLQYLLPIAHDIGVGMAAMAAGVDPEAGADEVSGVWNDKQIYCCSSVCPSILSSIGTALGYAVHIEMTMAFIGVVIYMWIFRDEAEDRGSSTWRCGRSPGTSQRWRGTQPRLPAS